MPAFVHYRVDPGPPDADTWIVGPACGWTDGVRATMTDVVDAVAGSEPGLRERKKQRTRTTLIDAAVKLCLEQGYEKTTVDQIAAAADVSSRTFSRYFATKDAVYLAQLDSLIRGVAAELELVPRDVSPVRALRDAHLALLGKVESGRAPGLSSSGLALMLHVINSTNELKLAAGEIQDPEVVRALADRMGVEPTSRRLRMVNSVWAAIIVTGCGDLTLDSMGGSLGPALMAQRITDSYDQFRALTTVVG